MGQRLPTVQVRTQLVEQVHLFIRNNILSGNLVIMLLLGVTMWMFLLMTLINRILPFDETFGHNISPLARAVLPLSSAYCPVLKFALHTWFRVKLQKIRPRQKIWLRKILLDFEFIPAISQQGSRRCSMLNS